MPDELVSPAPGLGADSPDELVMPSGQQNSLWAHLGRAFNPGMRAAMGGLSGGPVGLIGGLMGAAKQAAGPVQPTRTAQTLGEEFQAGMQGSSAGLLIRGRLPDIVLDPQHIKWYDKLAAGTGQLMGDLPAMAAGAAAAGAIGLPSGPGAIAAAGAGAFALPTAIREGLTTAYSLNQVQNSADFLSRVGIGVARTGRDALVGALTSLTGYGIASKLAPIAEGAVAAGQVSARTAQMAVGAASTAGEVGTMTVAPALLEGRLPEKDDFINAGIMVAGLKGLHIAVPKIMGIYARTGIPPEQVAADAKADPVLRAELSGEPIPRETQFPIENKTSYQGQRMGNLMGPNDEMLVAKGPDGNDAGRLWITKTPEGFEVRKVEVDPSMRRQGVATELYQEARDKFGTYAGSTDQTPEGTALVESLRQTNPEVFQPESEIPTAYRPIASAQAAADAFSGDKSQQVLDTPFSDIPETKLPYQLNMKYITGPDDLRALQARMAGVYRDNINAARGGTQTWAETETTAARQVADMTGQDIQKVLAGRQVGDAASAVELKIRGDILMQATNEAGAAIKAVKDAGVDATDAMKVDALAAIHRAALVQADFTGASAEVGRALNYLKSIKEIKDQGAGIQKLLDLYGGKPDELLAMAADMDSPEALAKFARGATKATTWQKVVEAWKAGLVSGPVTHIANIMGNTTYMAARPLVDLVASTPRALGAEGGVHPTEALARVIGNFQGTMDGLKLAKTAFIADTLGGKVESRTAIPGKTGYVIRTPFRALEALDEVFRTMNERGEAYAIGARQAIDEGLNPATREFRERVAEIAMTPDVDQAAQIEAFGKRATFKADLGPKGKAITKAIEAAHLDFAVPFIKTPANIFKEMARLTPGAPIIGEWRADVAAGGERATKAWAEVGIGTAISALTMGLAIGGHISGAGDPDPNKRRVQMAAGWQPYSVKIGDKWYSYQRFQPLGTLVGMAADMAEVWRHMTPEESDKVPKILATAFSNSVTSQTFLQGISTLVDALSDPDHKGQRFIRNLAGSAVPAVVGQPAAMLDPYQREVSSIRDMVVSRIPGLRETLMPQRDPFGEPVPGTERLGVISPVAIKDVSQDPVRAEAARLGVGASRAPQSISLPSAGTGLGKVDLTPEQRDVFGDVSGHLAYKVMDQMVHSPGWEYMPDFVKQRAFTLAFEKANMAGKAAALSDEQRQQEIHRIVTAVSEKLKPKDNPVPK